MKLSAYDFDGTLTTEDSLIAFIRYVFGRRRFLQGFALHALHLLKMRLGLDEGGRVKERIFRYFFKGMSAAEFERLGREFAATHRHLLRPQGMAQVRADIAAGRHVCIVSASIPQWVSPFFEGLDVEVMGTDVEVADGVLTGRFASANCYGAEKERRIRERFPKIEHLTAYGDSGGDRYMLAMADESHYRPFRDATV